MVEFVRIANGACVNIYMYMCTCESFHQLGLTMISDDSMHALSNQDRNTSSAENAGATMD